MIALRAALFLVCAKTICWASAAHFDLLRPTGIARVFLFRDEALIVAGLLLLVGDERSAIRRAAARWLSALLAIAYIVLTVAFIYWRGFFRFELLRFVKWQVMQASVASVLSFGTVAAILGAAVLYVLLGWLRFSIDRHLWLSAVLLAYSALGSTMRVEAANALLGSPVAMAFRKVKSPTIPEKAMLREVVQPLEVTGPRSPRYASLWSRLPAKPLNVIMICMESVRAQSLQVYGNPRPTSPFLDHERNHALIFDAFYAHDPRTVKSFEALMLGIYPEPGWDAVIWTHPDLVSADLATVLRERGYATLFGFNSPLSFDNLDAFLRHRGFDSVLSNDQLGDDRRLIPALERFVADHPQSPFFAVLWTFRSHHPFVLPTDLPHPFSAHSDRAIDRYDDAILATDQLVADLTRWLQARGLSEQTVIVITGDHGEVFGEHEHDEFGHGQSVYDESMRIPLIWLHPTLFAGLVPDPRAFQIKDLGASIMDLLGATPRLGEGRSVFRDYPRSAAFLSNSFNGLRFGIREDRWKLSLDLEKGTRALYDLAADPDERSDIASLHPGETAQLEAEIWNWYRWQGERMNDILQRSP